MGLCSWIVFGGLAGWVASLFSGTSANRGIIANVIIGVVGAVVGGILMHFIGGHGVTGFNLYSFGVAVLGSVVTITIARLVR